MQTTKTTAPRNTGWITGVASAGSLSSGNRIFLAATTMSSGPRSRDGYLEGRAWHLGADHGAARRGTVRGLGRRRRGALDGRARGSLLDHSGQLPAAAQAAGNLRGSTRVGGAQRRGRVPAGVVRARSDHYHRAPDRPSVTHGTKSGNLLSRPADEQDGQQLWEWRHQDIALDHARDAVNDRAGSGEVAAGSLRVRASRIGHSRVMPVRGQVDGGSARKRCGARGRPASESCPRMVGTAVVIPGRLGQPGGSPQAGRQRRSWQPGPSQGGRRACEGSTGISIKIIYR